MKNREALMDYLAEEISNNEYEYVAFMGIDSEMYDNVYETLEGMDEEELEYTLETFTSGYATIAEFDEDGEPFDDDE